MRPEIIVWFRLRKDVLRATSSPPTMITLAVMQIKSLPSLNYSREGAFNRGHEGEGGKGEGEGEGEGGRIASAPGVNRGDEAPMAPDPRAGDCVASPRERPCFDPASRSKRAATTWQVVRGEGAAKLHK